jgi:hypothetical protein
VRQRLVLGSVRYLSLDRDGSDLRDLPGGNQRTHGNQASITRRESGAKPEIAEQKIGRILHEPRDVAPKLALTCVALCLSASSFSGSSLSFAGGNWSMPIPR